MSIPTQCEHLDTIGRLVATIPWGASSLSHEWSTTDSHADCRLLSLCLIQSQSDSLRTESDHLTISRSTWKHLEAPRTTSRYLEVALRSLRGRFEVTSRSLRDRLDVLRGALRSKNTGGHFRYLNLHFHLTASVPIITSSTHKSHEAQKHSALTPGL
jgi:hypothetical protein